MTPTDALIRRIEELRPILDTATGRFGIQVRGILVDGTLTSITARVKPIEERRR